MILQEDNGLTIPFYWPVARNLTDLVANARLSVRYLVKQRLERFISLGF